MAVWPATTVWLIGCAVIVGATLAAVTVRVAGLLFTDPTLLLMITVNAVPLSPVVVGGVV